MEWGDFLVDQSPMISRAVVSSEGSLVKGVCSQDSIKAASKKIKKIVEFILGSFSGSPRKG